ncbi:MAG TPA: SCO family protein [Terriglobia bacterium]|nr:SCO family protein [Terriglobia bacterium]
MRIDVERMAIGLAAKPRRRAKSVMAVAAGLVLTGALGAARPALAQAPPASQVPPVFRDVGIDQRLNQQVPLDIPFRDEAGDVVPLRAFFGKRPVILSLVYYQCPMLCTTSLNGLEQSMREMKLDLGKDYEVVTVSFDPTETPRLAAAKKAVYVGLYGRPGAVGGWHFLTGDQDSIDRLTKAVGFRYHYDKNIKQFIHATGIIVLTPEGKVARYFYGIQYPAGNLRLGLVEASQGKIGNPVDAILLYCCEYDPQTGKYSLIISRALAIGAAVTVVCLGGLMLVMFKSTPGGARA